MNDKEQLNRRQFLACGVAAAAVAVARQSAADGVAKRDNGGEKKGGEAAKSSALGPLIVSAPVLQNAAETSIGVAFAVSADASGWVEYSTSPKLDGAKVEAEIVEQFRGPKLIAFKMKRRKGNRKRKGHRQELTKVRILSIA